MVNVRVAQSGVQEVGKLYVGTTHVAIQSAIDYVNSQGGGRVFIEKGTYTAGSPIDLYSNIELCGEGIHTFITSSISVSTDAGIIRAIGTSGAIKENIYIHDLRIGYNSVQSSGNLDAIRVNYCGDNTGRIGVKLENCTIQMCSRHGIILNYSSNNVITGNTVQNNNSHGIFLIGSSNNTITGNMVQNNNIYGIYLNTSSNSTITGNMVQNNGSHGIYLNSSSNNTITGNTVQNNGSHGIFLDSSSNSTITGNTIQNNGSSAFYIHSSVNNTITGNTIQNNSGNGILLQASSIGNTLTGNIILFNVYTPISINSSCNSNTVCGNVSLSVNNNGSGNIVDPNK